MFFWWVLNFENEFYKNLWNPWFMKLCFVLFFFGFWILEIDFIKKLFLCFFNLVWEAKEGEIYVLEWSKEKLEIFNSSLYVQSLPQNIPNCYYIFVYLQSPWKQLQIAWTLFDLKNWSFFSTLELCLIWRPWVSFDVKMNLNFVRFEEEHLIFPWFENKFELVLSTWICFELEREFEFFLVWRRPCTCFQHLIEL